MTISQFAGEHSFLSNFYHWPFEFEVLDWGKYEAETVEHAFQACKAVNQTDFEWVLAAAHPGEAKKRGRKIDLEPRWEEIKDEIMAAMLLKKFEHPHMSAKLIATGDQKLVEGNWWGDTYWGVCNGEGKNVLGHLLMNLREALREDNSPDGEG